mgnify:FL=1
MKPVNRFLKTISLLTVISFLYSNVVWSAPLRLAAVEEKAAVVTTLAAKSQAQEKTVLDTLPVADLATTIAPMLVDAYQDPEDKTLAERRKVDPKAKSFAEKIEEVKGVLARTEYAKYKPQILYDRTVSMDATATASLDFVAFSLVLDGKEHALVIHLKDIVPADKQAELNKAVKGMLPEVISFKMGRDYVFGLHEITKGKAFDGVVKETMTKIEAAKDKPAQDIVKESQEKPKATKSTRGWPSSVFSWAMARSS